MLQKVVVSAAQILQQLHPKHLSLVGALTWESMLQEKKVHLLEKLEYKWIHSDSFADTKTP